MKNKVFCPAKGTWMCKEVDGNCKECALAHSKSKSDKAIETLLCYCRRKRMVEETMKKCNASKKHQEFMENLVKKIKEETNRR